MRGFGRLVWAAALAATGALSIGTASAAGPVNESLVATGALTYTWHGDPAHGCAALNECDVQGEIVLRAIGQGQFAQFAFRGPSDLFVQTTGTVRVRGGGAEGGECVAPVGQNFPGVDVQIRHGRDSLAVIQQVPGSGPCAGPLQRDLAALKIPVRRSGGRRPSFDLRTNQSFVAGPFSGTLVSTLRLRPAPGQGSSGAGSSGSFASSSPGPAPVNNLLEYARIVYTVTPGSSGIRTQFSGSGDSSCQVVASCGASGSLGLAVQPVGKLMIFASRTVHRHLSSAQVRRDLSQGRLLVNGFLTLNGTVSESYAWSDGSSCRDSVPISQLQLLLGSPSSRGPGGRHPVTIQNNTAPGIELMRTHCPGPTDDDLGVITVLGRGSVTTRELLAKHVTLDLTERSGFSGLGYTGTRSGSIQLNLTRTKLIAASSGGAG